jgi:hypothetical protein
MNRTSHYLNYRKNPKLRGKTDLKRTIPPIIECRKQGPYENANPAEQAYIRPAMTRPAFERQITSGGTITVPISTGSASGGNVQGYQESSGGATIFVASFESMSGTNMTGTGFVSTNSNTETITEPLDSGGTEIGVGSLTYTDVGNIAITDNIIGISDFNSFGNVYITSIGDGSYISFDDCSFVGIEKRVMDYAIGYLEGNPSTSVNLNSVITSRISSIVGIGYDNFIGSKFTVFGGGTVDPVEVSKGVYWTSTGTNRNTLTIQGNLLVEKGTAIVRVDRMITSNPVYGVNIQTAGTTVPTTEDVGMEMAWNTSLINQFTISSIATYSPTKTLIVTSTPNNYIVGDQVYVGDSNSSPSIDGIWTIVDVIDASSFTITKTITSAGDSGIVSVSFEIAFLGYDVTTQRLKYISNVDSSAGGIYTATHYGGFHYGCFEASGIYLSDELYIGNTPYAKYYLSSDDLMIENNNNSTNITLRANNGTSTQTVLDMNESSLSATMNAININQKLNISSNGTDVEFDLLNQTDDFNINVTNSSVVRTLINIDGLTGYVGINEVTTPNAHIDVNGNSRLHDTKYLYLGGGPTTDGTWRMWNDTINGLLVIQKRVSGSWNTITTIEN